MEKLKYYLKRYFIDGMSAMALGLFASLIIGLIITQISKLPYLGFMANYAVVLGASSPVVGAAIGGAIGWGLKVKPLVQFSAIAAAAFGYSLGGPVGAYISAIIACEAGSFVSGKTKIDIVVTPFVAIVAGGIAAEFTGPAISGFMNGLGGIINTATTLSPIPMGIIISVVVGMALTAPISSAALCIMLGLEGLAAGAAAVGCSAQMVGFAVASYRENGVGGLLSQGIGTSMLQFGNIMRHPQIWIAPTLAAAVLGPISTAVFKMTNIPTGAGMGTSGFVGQFGAISAMSADRGMATTLILIAVMHFILPAILTLFFDKIMRKLAIVKSGYMKI